jgi:hypothetical protein
MFKLLALMLIVINLCEFISTIKNKNSLGSPASFSIFTRKLMKKIGLLVSSYQNNYGLGEFWKVRTTSENLDFRKFTSVMVTSTAQ